MYYNYIESNRDKMFIFIIRAQVQYRSASLFINPASEAGACTDCEYIECTIAIIIIVILERSLFLVYKQCLRFVLPLAIKVHTYMYQ